RRQLSALTWTLDDAPTERERLRALAELASRDRLGADALARANGWERRLERAVSAFKRPTKLTHPLVVAQLGSKLTLNVTELDRTRWRDLEAVVHDECAGEVPLVPRRFEVAFGSERAPQELQRGLDLGDGLSLSGKIDRIDVDPFGARGIVQDYKSGKHAHSAREIESELRLQIPLYMLVLRDLVGLEPLGGLYRPLAGERKARGLLRASETETLPGYARNDYLEEDAFWAAVGRARATAR